MKKINLLIFSFFVLNAFLSSCSSIVDSLPKKPTAPVIIPPSATVEIVFTETLTAEIAFTETPPIPTIEAILTSTLDICAPENIGTEIEKIHKIMHAFEDTSLLASSTPNQQLYSAISDLQRIRREAEYLEIPICLENLKKLQLTHMETVINTMMAFYTGTNSETVNAGILQARQEHDAYTFELVELLGGMPTPNATQVAEASLVPTETALLDAVLTVTLLKNLSAANMRDTPSPEGKVVDWLERKQVAEVFGQIEGGSWFLLSIPSQPDKKAWVASSSIEIVEGNKESLPIITPVPIIETEEE